MLEWTTEFFNSKQLDPARLSAEILLAEALGCERIELYTRFDCVPVEAELVKYRDWVKRHAAGEPVAYLVGHREFYSLKFEVNADVLIPRPETEHVVMAALDVASQFDSAVIADIGTGSGAIAVTLAHQLANSTIWATDVSPSAIAVAERNANAHQVHERIRFAEGHLLAPLPEGLSPHIVVSNPPYIGRSEVSTVDQSVRDYEPDIALFGGDHGTDVIEPLVKAAAKRLLPGGFLIFETSPLIFDRCLEFVKLESAFESAQSIKDFAGHLRVIQARKKA